LSSKLIILQKPQNCIFPKFTRLWSVWLPLADRQVLNIQSSVFNSGVSGPGFKYHTDITDNLNQRLPAELGV
jgi:hypothetical protein